MLYFHTLQFVNNMLNRKKLNLHIYTDINKYTACIHFLQTSNPRLMDTQTQKHPLPTVG